MTHGSVTKVPNYGTMDVIINTKTKELTGIKRNNKSLQISASQEKNRRCES